ncbi:coiled-coil domain-containing protein 180-like isoform X2 [Bolinopsis microptera]|uniref:coiled-coil domain-containing protein 180-like isoform X2 n=1 Tax=Bolinopsis microptera TaxID=2820187 RepID=UPI003079ECE9
MVETASLPELKLRPEFRADAEVKFMNTLVKPKKVTSVRSGKIPLVKTTEKTEGWPAGNPTAIKHALDSGHYEMAEDEPFYASKEVERLEDNLYLVTGQGKETKKSDIIERITESRRQRHKNALEDLHEELGHLNKAVEPQVANELDSTKEQISWILSEIHILFSGIENDNILFTYPLKRLQVLWEDVVTLLQKRSNKITDLREQLNETESQRKDQISELFKHYSASFHDIAYLNTGAINLLMDLEVYTSNQLLLTNYKHYSNMISQIQLENVVRLRQYRVRWEERLATWRDLHTHQTTDKFTTFMYTPAITDCPDIESISEMMKCELNGLVERRFNKLQSVREMKPPSFTCKTVLRWYEEVCELSLTLENTHRKYVAKLAAVGDKVLLDCETVADRMLETLQEEGVCSDSEAQDLKFSDLMPLIAVWGTKHREKILRLEEKFSDEAAKFKSNLHLLYDFQNGAANIWTEYCSRVTDKNSELSALVRKCRRKHDEINQRLESSLDMEMDRMRQDTNDFELKKHLDKATEALEEIAAAYTNFKRDMADVIKTYPDMISNELLNYSMQIRKHLSCYTEEDTKVEDGEEGLGSDNASIGGIVDQAPHESTEKGGVDIAFMTEVSAAAPQQPPSYSDERFKVLEEGLTIVYLEHLDLLTHEVAQHSDQTVGEKLSELKSEVELRHHIHKPRVTRMKLDIYNVRLNELKNHDERVKQHGAGITLEISTLRSEFKKLGMEHDVKGKKFKQLVEDCEKTLPTLEKTAHLQTLQNKVTTAYEGHMNVIKLELSSFRNKMEMKLNDLRESNQHFGLAFKPFAEGGNFGPDEIETFRKKLEKCNLKIDNCETFILTELDGMESKCLDAAVEMTSSFEARLKMHILDVAFLEKVNSWMSNCQVKIKTEVAACNMMSKKLKTKIESLRKLIDSCARPHPDKPTVKPEEVLSAIPDMYNLFQQRIMYLDCAKPATKTSVQINPDHPDFQMSRESTHDFQSVVNLTKNILTMSRKYSSPSMDSESVTIDKRKPIVTESLYQWFIAKQENPKPMSKRGKSRVETSERTKRLGSASSRSSMMSVVLTDAQSFMPIIKKILQETQGALFISSEAYYTQYQGPPLRTGIAETLEGCMEELNKRLNNYYVQTQEFYNKCIQDLRSILTDVLQLHMEIPPLLYDEILEKYVTEVSQKTSVIKHQFDQNRAKIADLRETNKVQLKPILGHPNREIDMNNLCRREEGRALESGDVLYEYYNELTNTERSIAQNFIESINYCTERLMNLFDQLITTDDVILGTVAEEKLPTTVLLKRELRAKQGDQTSLPGLSREGQQIKLLRLADIAVDRTASSKSENFKTGKFTPVHEEALSSMNRVCGEYKERFGLVMEEIESLSAKWTSSEEKWKRQWLSSVQHVRNLYKPNNIS